MSEKQKFNGTGQGRVFKSPFLEMFTKTSPIIAFFTDVPLIIFFLVLGHIYFPIAIGKAALIYVIALFSWSFSEYILHRYIFHFINEWKWSERFHYIVHGVHHEYPRDEERLFMPPLPSYIYAALFFGIFWLILGKYALYFMPGFINGYSIYSFTHWAIHKFQPPKGLKFLWKHHNMHHYRTNERAFGVSSTLWDHVFGTMPPEK
ncbi:MAG TPA: sterol desaturase family protein [Bacteroidia bacterium]|nr:sterol desaturase family protein [Bacteroidia bacterium]